MQELKWKTISKVIPSKQKPCPYCSGKVNKHGIRKTKGKILQEYVCTKCFKASYLTLSESNYDGRRSNIISIKLSDYQKGLLEAFIDGEGSLGVIKYRSDNRDKFIPYCRISNTNINILNKIKNITGGKIHSNGNEKNPKWNKCYEITIPTKILRQILPQLDLCKKQQRQLVIKALELVNYQRGLNHPMTISQTNRLNKIHNKLKIINGYRYNKRNLGLC